MDWWWSKWEFGEWEEFISISIFDSEWDEEVRRWRKWEMKRWAGVRVRDKEVKDEMWVRERVKKNVEWHGCLGAEIMMWRCLEEEKKKKKISLLLIYIIDIIDKLSKW